MLIEFFLQNGKVKKENAFITGLEFTGIDIVGVVKGLLLLFLKKKR